MTHSNHSTAGSAIVAYVPALHAGYAAFFRKHTGAPVYVLGKSFIDAYPRLNRDIRALAPQEAAAALRALGFIAHVLEVGDVSALKPYKEIVLPDEDVSRDFAAKYLPENKVTIENIFLRWEGVFANKEVEPSPDRTVSTDVLDHELMREAVKEGRRSADWWRQIGGLAVKDGTLLARSHTQYFPSDLALDILGTPRTTVDAGERPDLYISMHAEAAIVAQAAAEGFSLKGASLYVSTFPCINCAFLIAKSGVARLYYAEGYSRIDAEGVLKSADVEIVQVKL